MGEMKSATKGGSQRRKIEFAKRIVEALIGMVTFESEEGDEVLPSRSLRQLSDLFHVKLLLTASIKVVELGMLKAPRETPIEDETWRLPNGLRS